MTIKLEVYDLFLFFNPYKHTGHNPHTHPNPYGVRIEEAVRNIGQPLRMTLQGQTFFPEYGR